MKRSNQEVYQLSKESSGGDYDKGTVSKIPRSLHGRFLSRASSPLPAYPGSPMLPSITDQQAQVLSFKCTLLEWNNIVCQDLEVSTRDHVDYMLQGNATPGGRCQQQSILFFDSMNLAQASLREFSREIQSSLARDFAKITDPDALVQQLLREPRQCQKQQDKESIQPRPREQQPNTTNNNNNNNNNSHAMNSSKSKEKHISTFNESCPRSKSQTETAIPAQCHGQDQTRSRLIVVAPPFEMDRQTKNTTGKRKCTGERRSVLSFFANFIPGWTTSDS